MSLKDADLKPGWLAANLERARKRVESDPRLRRLAENLSDKPTRSDVEVAARALCQDARWHPCPCASGHPCEALTHWTNEASAVVGALRCAHRLVTSG